MYVLYDIKYLLSAVPLPEVEEGSQMQTQVTDDTDSTSGRWSEPLRKGFLHGFHMLLSLLASMEVRIKLALIINKKLLIKKFHCREWMALLGKRANT